MESRKFDASALGACPEVRARYVSPRYVSSWLLFGGPRRSCARYLARGVAWFTLAWRIRRERRDLAGVSNHLLRDIGVTPDDARLESRRRFSDIPGNRLRRQ
ncbi:MAG: DUF1127 domain-containing protein [Burkholderiaceae bacterium]